MIMQSLTVNFCIIMIFLHGRLLVSEISTIRTLALRQGYLKLYFQKKSLM